MADLVLVFYGKSCLEKPFIMQPLNEKDPSFITFAPDLYSQNIDKVLTRNNLYLGFAVM